MVVIKKNRYKNKKAKKMRKGNQHKKVSQNKKGKKKTIGKRTRNVGTRNVGTRKARKKIKGGFVEIPGYLVPFMYGGSFISIYVFMLSMLANNPDVAKKIRAKSKVINEVMTKREIADEKKQGEKDVLKKILKSVGCKKYTNMVKEIFEDQSADDKTKFAERYNKLFEFMESSEASDEKKKNFNEWNQKMNEFFKLLCDDDYSKKDELRTCLDELKTLTDNITRIIFLKQFYTDLFDDLYYAFDDKIRENVGRGMGDDDDYSDNDFDDYSSDDDSDSYYDDDSDSDSDSDY